MAKLFEINPSRYAGVLISLCMIGCGIKSSQPPLPVVGQVPSFTFIDHNAREFGADNLKNKIWIADFVYTTCVGPCPIMSRNMASLHRSYALDPRVVFVTITVDPEFDSPQVLKDYADTHGAKSGQWVFLTSDSASIHRLAYGGFKIGSQDDPLFHSTKFVLVDAQARVRGYYEGIEDEEVAKLFRDIARLLEETA